MALLQNESQALKGLQKFVKSLVKSRVKDRSGYRRWLAKAGNEQFMEECFGYKRVGKMPKVTALLAPYFHEELPLIGLNYSPVAHNTLHAFPKGWTPALRLCRGLILDRKGAVVAMGFNKFFNYGEHPETTKLPARPFVVTQKMDGHLGIIFEYGGAVHLCTRQSFHGPTAKLGGEMLKKRAPLLPHMTDTLRNVTVLVEIIHPKTKVHVDYGDREDFVIIGAKGRVTLRDYPHHELESLGTLLKLPVVERWEGRSIADLRRLMKDRSVANQEGFVACYDTGLRVKFKFERYVGLMVESKLSYGYLMNRILTGSLKKMVHTLDFEGQTKADEMVAAIKKAAKIADKKARNEYLYKLDAEKQKNSYYRGICRKYAASL